MPHVSPFSFFSRHFISHPEQLSMSHSLYQDTHPQLPQRMWKEPQLPHRPASLSPSEKCQLIVPKHSFEASHESRRNSSQSNSSACSTVSIQSSIPAPSARFFAPSVYPEWLIITPLFAPTSSRKPTNASMSFVDTGLSL